MNPNKSLITINALARIARVNRETVRNRLRKNGIETVMTADKRLAVDAQAAADLLAELVEFLEECWTIDELSESLGLSRDFIRRAHELGLLKKTYCRMRAGFRFTQEDIKEFLCRLEFANPSWREERHQGKKCDTQLQELIDSYDAFPSVEGWEEIRAYGFKAMRANCWQNCVL